MKALQEQLLPGHVPKLAWSQVFLDELSRIAAGERQYACHLAPALAQAICALGIVYLKMAMNEAAVDSITFAFWRFFGATPLHTVASQVRLSCRAGLALAA